MINHAQWQRLRSSPANHNEYLKLELSEAWEPPCRHCTLSLGEGKSSQCFIFNGDKTNSVEKMRKIQLDLRYNSMLAVPCVYRDGGLAMFWKEEVSLHIQTFSLNHIDAHVMIDPN